MILGLSSLGQHVQFLSSIGDALSKFLYTQTGGLVFVGVATIALCVVIAWPSLKKRFPELPPTATERLDALEKKHSDTSSTNHKKLNSRIDEIASENATMFGQFADLSAGVEQLAEKVDKYQQTHAANVSTLNDSIREHRRWITDLQSDIGEGDKAIRLLADRCKAVAQHLNFKVAVGSQTLCDITSLLSEVEWAILFLDKIVVKYPSRELYKNPFQQKWDSVFGASVEAVAWCQFINSHVERCKNIANMRGYNENDLLDGKLQEYSVYWNSNDDRSIGLFALRSHRAKLFSARQKLADELMKVLSEALTS